MRSGLPHGQVLSHFAVKESTQSRYRGVLRQFTAWLEANMIDQSLDKLVQEVRTLEQMLLCYFDHLYLEDKSDVSAGTALIAAIGHQYPHLHQLGRRGVMPSLSRALQGWEKMHPTGTRMPLPYPAWCAIVIDLHRRGLKSTACLTLEALDCYVRPGKALSLCGYMFVPPQPLVSHAYRFWSILAHPWQAGRPSKTNQYDDSILLDSQWRPAVSAAAEILHRDTPRQAPVATLSHATWQQEVSRSANLLGLESPHLYTLRHSGPSEDFLRGRRTLTETKRRGRWQCENNVKRYEKGARLLARMTEWSTEQKLHFRECERVLQEVLQGRMTAPSFQVSLKRKRSSVDKASVA
jgi:hypothetical protein